MGCFFGFFRPTASTTVSGGQWECFADESFFAGMYCIAMGDYSAFVPEMAAGSVTSYTWQWPVRFEVKMTLLPFGVMMGCAWAS